MRHKQHTALSKSLNQGVTTTPLSHCPLQFCKQLNLPPHVAASAHGKPITRQETADLSIIYFKATVRKPNVSKSFKSTIMSHCPNKHRA